jgi:hypothetical protein
MINLQKKPEHLRNGYKDPERMRNIHEIGCSLCLYLKEPQRSPTQAHHKIGMGLGKKASDRFSMALCSDHHQHGPDAIHHIGTKAWERKFDVSQDDLILLTDRMLDHITVT